MRPTSRVLVTGLALLIVACGSDGGPSFASSMNALTDTIAAENGLALVINTFAGSMFDWSPSTPAPYFVRGAASRLDARTRALAILDRYRLQASHGSGRADLAKPLALVPPPAAVAATCPTITGGDDLGHPLDVDADGVPDDYTVDFGNACSFVDSSGLVNTFSGKYRIVDTDSGLASFAFTATHFKLLKTDGSTGDHVSHELNATESGSFLSSGASHREQFTLAYISSVGGDNGKTTFTLAETSGFLPSTGQALVRFDSLPAGTFDYSADFRISGLDQPGNFRFVLTTDTGLTFSPTCIGQAGPFTGGTFTGLLNGSETHGFQLAWNTPCGAPTVTFFGTTS